ncbi:MAG: hypothetical protein ACKVVP_15170 [Chloroflexota bacterium]
MSIYSVHKVCHLIDKDDAFRARVQQNPAEALADFRLTETERTALLKGDVARLHDLGAHGFLLGRLQRHGVFGLDPSIYITRMKGGASV